MSDYKKSLLYCILFCLLVLALEAKLLFLSYEQEKEKVRERVGNTSFLIGEWIKGGFRNSDYVLRDVASQVSSVQLRYPHPDPVQHAQVTSLLKDKFLTLDFAVGMALISEACVITHQWLTPPLKTIIGFDGSSRDWCKLIHSAPQQQTFVTQAFENNTGIISVNQIRRLPWASGGFAGLTVDLKFFSDWLKQIKIGPHGVLAISDENVSLLAREPENPEALGKKVNDPVVAAFVASGEKYKTYEDVSPLDGEPRLYGIRKIEGLPFIVVVGEADRDWQADWRRVMWGTGAAVLVLWVMAIITLRSYWQRLKNLTELQRARDSLAEISVTDGLTGLANRRRFDEVLEAEYRRMYRKQALISIIMIDVDYFKAFNDTYGHVVGDECLKSVSEVIRNNLKRPQDLAARYGGEEFCAILPETDHQAAVAIATHIKDGIAALGIPHEGSSVADHVTASLGVATVVCNEDIRPESIVGMADKRLYWAKENGRNRVGSKTADQESAIGIPVK